MAMAQLDRFRIQGSAEIGERLLDSDDDGDLAAIPGGWRWVGLFSVD
jgi:hypothetical protein